MTRASGEPERITLLDFLRGELAPRPGRMRAVWRITAGCVAIVVFGMVFRLPIIGYSVYIVFMVSREEAASSLITGLGGVIAVSIAVALSLLFYILDAAAPALRFPLLALSTFGAMFFARTSTLGPLALLAGFVLMLSQTLIDDMPSVEYLTRFLLWLWVVVALPAFVTVMINLIWGENPAALMRRRIDVLLEEVVRFLKDREPVDLVKLQDETVESIELHQHAGMWDRRLKAQSKTDLGMFQELATILSLLRALPSDTPAAARFPLAKAIEACRVALPANAEPTLRRCMIDADVLSSLDGAARPVVAALQDAVDRLLQGASDRLNPIAEAAPAKSMFVPDAFTNPAHARFAIKVTLAAMLAYVIYSLLDWPGIRTAVTTCFFVALGSVAETVHKLSLRLSGAILGGVAAGFCIVYLLPHMTDIGDLVVLVAVMSALSAWVATSSERLSYAGMQMAFAFYLGVLHDYAPTVDLAELRDRVVGILLGNILMSIIFSALWPVSALEVVQYSMSKVLGLLANLIAKPAPGDRPSHLAAVQELVRARKLAALALFERGFMSHRVAVPDRGRFTIAQLDRIASAVFVVQGQSPGAHEASDEPCVRDAAAHWLNQAAGHVKEGHAPPPAIEWPGETEAGAGRDAHLRREAMAYLRTEIADVVPPR
jgi:multidrug resistance protein MdtO